MMCYNIITEREQTQNQKTKGLDFMMNVFDNFDYEELMEVMEHFHDDEEEDGE